MEVPKFCSFKPKKEPVPEEVNRSEVESKYSSSHRVHKHHRSKERDQNHREDRHEDASHDRRQQSGSLDKRRRSEGRDSRPKHERPRTKDAEISLKQERRTADDKSIAITQHELLESDLFIVDRRGDAKNVEYGSLHRYSVPTYRRTGYGNLIGHPLSSKIDRDSSNEKEVCLIDAVVRKRGLQKTSRLLSSKYGKNSESRQKFVSAVGPELLEGVETDFIELSLRKRKRGSEPSEFDGGVDYRSIEGKAKSSNKPADEDVKNASDSDGIEQSSLDLCARQESAVLSKKAKADPLMLGPWLALANHQSQLVRAGVDPAELATSERVTLTELRLSILHEAGKHISAGKPGREQLLLAMIEAGKPSWDKTKLAAKWKEVLKECSASLVLWKRYMDFVQYDHSSFQYETCQEAYLTWLQVLKSAYEASSEENRHQVSEPQIYALLRFTTFLRDAGYDELALSIWQVLLELHFFTPKDIERSSLDARLDSLEDYWDIECPRIGEEAALTWAGFHELGPSNATLRTPVQLPGLEIDPQAPFASFAREEARIAQMFVLPASMEDDDAVIDPFRCVMFDDLRPIVERLSMELPAEGLIEAFLHYSGMPPLPNGRADTQQWSRDSQLARGTESFKMLSQRQTTLSLFQGGFQSFQDLSSSNSGSAKFIDRTLDSLLHAVSDGDDEFREYFLAFKANMFPNEASKTAKKLLKARPMSLRLYNAFALIEVRAGHMDKAIGVWNAALGMLPKLEHVAQDDAVLLWHSRMLTQVYHASETAALQTLLAISNPGTLSGTSDEQNSTHTNKLRLRRDLESGLDRMLLSRKSSHAVLYADLLAWLTYLTQDVTIAISNYNLHNATLTRSGMADAVEELQQCKARMLAFHIDRQRPYKPATFQHEIVEALQLFPCNSVLLKLQSRIASQDRLRSLVTEQKRLSESKMTVIEWSFKLQAEIDRVGDMATGGGTVNNVRATFSKALLTPTSGVAHSAALWKAWLTFELERGDDRQRAKNVFLDGLRALPGVKEWSILGMRDGLLEEREMRRVWEGMIERGLRMRIEIEDFL